MAVAEERVEGVNYRGESLGGVLRSLTEHPENTGVYGASGHLLLVDDGPGSRYYVVAVRSAQKKRWPRALDFSAGGMSSPGEAPIITVVRETSEELLLRLEETDLEFVASWRPCDGYWSHGAVYRAQTRDTLRWNALDIDELRPMTADELVAAAEDEATLMKPDLRTFVKSHAELL